MAHILDITHLLRIHKYLVMTFTMNYTKYKIITVMLVTMIMVVVLVVVMMMMMIIIIIITTKLGKQ